MRYDVAGIQLMAFVYVCAVTQVACIVLRRSVSRCSANARCMSARLLCHPTPDVSLYLQLQCSLICVFDFYVCIYAVVIVECRNLFVIPYVVIKCR